MINNNYIFKVLLSPYFSEKSNILIKKRNVIVLKVMVSANKIDIKKAVKKLFNVQVKSVNTVLMKGKKKKNNKNVIFKKSWKKAYVTLKEGHNLNFINNKE
ncbi:50S ribosomal protein L23 [Buchnera aphidicola]|uniref:50S ribosomal protein L23 n=1 Tax=Buchnera aphidicola TaxID=9 RepID=UPI0031B87069